jgi:hypothetical protein
MNSLQNSLRRWAENTSNTPTVLLAESSISGTLQAQRTVNRVQFRVPATRSTDLNTALTALSLPVTVTDATLVDFRLWSNAAFINFLNTIQVSMRFNLNGVPFIASDKLSMFYLLYLKTLFEGSVLWSYDFAAAGTRLVTLYFDYDIAPARYFQNGGKSKAVIFKSQLPEFRIDFEAGTDSIKLTSYQDFDAVSPNLTLQQFRVEEQQITTLTSTQKGYNLPETNHIYIAARNPTANNISYLRLDVDGAPKVDVQAGDIDILNVKNFSDRQDISALNAQFIEIYQTVENANAVSASQKTLYYNAAANFEIFRVVAQKV